MKIFHSNIKNFLDIVNIIKIITIIIVASYLVLDIIPFYEGANSYFYAIESINFSKGVFVYTNEFLENTGRQEFVTGNWLITIHNTAVPIAGIGLGLIGSIFFTASGYFGLFYLTPIFAIILLITTERLGTLVCNRYVGLIALLILATSNLVLRNSIQLQNDTVFAVFLILGIYFLIRFTKKDNVNYLLIASIFFTFSSFIRVNGIIIFPIEILIIIIYFSRIRNKFFGIKPNIINHTSRKKIKIIFFILIPWIIFISYWFAFYDYNFGDPFTNYRLLQDNDDVVRDSTISSLFMFKDSDWNDIKQFSMYLLPYQVPGAYNSMEKSYDESILFWPGMISLILLFTITIIFIKKNKNWVFLIFLVIIFSNVWFYSAITTEERSEKGVPGRYMIPVFPLSSIMIGFIIFRIFFNPKKDNTKFFRKKIIKIVGCILLIIFFTLSFFFSPISNLFNSEFVAKNPWELSERYPLDLERLDQNSVIVTLMGERAMEYQLTPFKIIKNGEISNNSTILLKEIIEKGNDVYVFKKSYTVFEKNLMSDLINDYEFILKDYSKTFCKVELSSSENLVSDLSCMNNEPIRKPQK
jgi:hypothetical protein